MASGLHTRLPGGALPVSPQGDFTEAEVADSTRQLFFKFTVGLIFLEISMVHQTLAYLLHTNLYLMFVFGIPPLLGVAFCGGLGRAFRGAPTRYWVGYALWMAMAVPFSSWPGGSAPLVMDYLRTDLPILFIVGGLVLTWKECETLMAAGALGAIAVLLTASMFQSDDPGSGGRLELQAGTIRNSNDFSGHLMLALGFLLWVGLNSKSKAKRIVSLLGVGLGILDILKTASRGAEIGLGAAVLVFLLFATPRRRIGVMVMGPITLVALVASIPAETLDRLMTFSSSPSGGSSEAVQSAMDSAAGRQYLLRTSITYTFQFPLFGVGPGQFSGFEGSHNKLGGTDHGNWHDTHNSYTQASSENGIVGGLFFLTGALSSIFLLAKTVRAAKKHPDCRDVETGAFCMLVGSVGFFVAIGFLNFAYYFYGPFLGGLAICVSRAANEEFRRRGHKSEPVKAPPPSRPRARIHNAVSGVAPVRKLITHG